MKISSVKNIFSVKIDKMCEPGYNKELVAISDLNY